MKMKKTINRLLIGTLACGIVAGIIVPVYADDGNELPFVSFEPVTTPSEPEISDISLEPEIPEVPDTPSEPDISGTSENTPDWSELFEWLDQAEEPKMPDSTAEKDSPKDTPQESQRTTYQTCRRDESCTMYSFTDLDRTAWYHDGIHYCTENGLMNGTSTYTFEPDTALTRAMIVTVLWRLEGEPVLDTLMQFTDVRQDEWYTEAIRWAAAEGIVNGYGDGTFGPVNDVTREQVMAILHRYAAYKGLDNSEILSMIPQYDYSQWAENDIIWADMVGIIGIGVDIFDMTANASRAEIAAYLMKFCVRVDAK